MRLAQTFLVLFLFGASFGYVEAAVVVYLRAFLEPVRQASFQRETDDGVFPLLTADQIQSAGPRYVRILTVEAFRELATLVMLAAVGLAIAANFRQWFAGFMISFGVWDIFYYVFLRLLVGWPDSLMTSDILFLVPVPWVGPVISPVIIAVSMIVAGAAILWREAIDRPIAFRTWLWGIIFSGGLIVIIAFCWDWRQISAGGLPNPFNWSLFVAGGLVGIAGFLHAYWRGDLSELNRLAVVEPERI
jgi:hypothetical protein